MCIAYYTIDTQARSDRIDPHEYYMIIEEMGTAKEWKWGYISQKGEFVVAPAFDGASDFHEGLAAVAIDWARGYIDRDGNFVITPAFEAAGNFHDGIAFVRVDGETRCIDRNGNFKEGVDLPEPQEPRIESGFDPHFEFHDGLARFVENQKFGYKDKDGNVIIKPIFFDATDFSEGLACVKKGKTGSWGYIDTSGRISIPARFRQAKPFHEGLAAVLTSVEQ